MKKLFIIISVFFSLGFSSLFCQEEDDLIIDLNKKTDFIDFVLQFTPSLYLNPESKLVSAPSPVVYPIGFGFLFPCESKVAVQPSLSFFMMYHLWYDGMALPSEIENRTSQTVCLLFDCPAVFQIFAGERSRFQIYAGPAVLMRFGFLAGGVKESDSGFTGTAGGDMDEINSWFWNGGRFLYASAGASFLYSFSSHLKAGPELNVCIPLGSLINGEGVQAMIISLGLKLCI